MWSSYLQETNKKQTQTPTCTLGMLKFMQDHPQIIVKKHHIIHVHVQFTEKPSSIMHIICDESYMCVPTLRHSTYMLLETVGHFTMLCSTGETTSIASIICDASYMHVVTLREWLCACCYKLYGTTLLY